MHYPSLRDASGKFRTKDKKIHTMRVTDYEKQVILEIRQNFGKEKCYFCKQEHNLIGVHLDCLQEMNNFRK